MRTRAFAIALLILPASARADGPGVSVHVAYAHTWAEPTMGPTAVWNGGDGGSVGFQVPLAHGPSRFHNSRSGVTTSSAGQERTAAALEIGAGYRTRPIPGPLCLEIGARELLLGEPVETVRDGPIRIDLAR